MTSAATAGDAAGAPGRPSRLVTLGVTGDWAFAAGTLLSALRRHNPDLDADILVFHDEALRPTDQALLEGLGARCEPFAVACDGLRPEAVRLFSPLCLAKFACFRLLSDYESVLWLDTDLLKMLSALVVAVFLGVPYLRSTYFSRKKKNKEVAKDA